jgi:hypothetical protein
MFMRTVNFALVITTVVLNTVAKNFTNFTMIRSFMSPFYFAYTAYMFFSCMTTGGANSIGANSVGGTEFAREDDFIGGPGTLINGMIHKRNE